MMQGARSLLLALVLASAHVQAAEPDDATKSSARRLGEEAGELYQKGDYGAALEKYQRAAALVNVPTIGVRIARCLDKLGRLVEANERYVAVIRTKLAPDALEVHKQAVADAATEQAALAPRIPSVVVNVRGPMEVEVSVGDKPLARALYGEKTSVDPGKHRVTARLGEVVQTRDVQVKEAETASVDFDFQGVPVPAKKAAAQPSGSMPAESEGSSARSAGGAQRTLGWVGLAVGGAGLAVGGIFGLTAVNKKNTLEESCGADLACPPSSHDNAESYNRMRTVSTIGFVVGGIGVAAGATLLLTAPRSDGRQVGAWVGPGSLGMRGRF